jgi:hypothetical protein
MIKGKKRVISIRRRFHSRPIQRLFDVESLELNVPTVNFSEIEARLMAEVASMLGIPPDTARHESLIENEIIDV